MDNKISSLKLQIEELINSGNIYEAKSLLLENEEILKYSIDYFILKSLIHYIEGDYNNAKISLEEGLSYNPYNFEINYNLIIICLYLEEFEKSSGYFFNLLNFKNMSDEEYKIHAKELLNSILNHIENIGVDDNKKLHILSIFKEKLKIYNEYSKKSSFKDFPNKNYTNQESYLGSSLTLNNKKYYVGIYNNNQYGLNNLTFNNIEQLRMNVNSEIFETTYEGLSYSITLEEDNIIPILATENSTSIKIKCNDEDYKIDQIFSNKYYYYTLKGNIEITSNKNIIIGKPLKLVKNEKNKDLVLTIFIDGLSYAFLEEQGLENIMPNTYKFFNKGTICKKCYTTGEWTLPSVASMCTGLHTTSHHLFHPSRKDSISNNIKTLFEIYQDEGYNTCVINNDWRVTPQYGYLRGVDRFIYKPYLDDSNVLYEALAHLRTFKSSNQYMWLSFMDLHKVSDNIIPDIFVQSKMSLQEKSKKVFDTNKSVNQSVNDEKIAHYKYQILNLDSILENLYNYIENNFDMDKCVITLVSDHGKPFLQSVQDFNLKEEKTRVPLMIRHKELDKIVSDELIQTTDYLSILTNLSQINVDLKSRNSFLPKFLNGEKERDYTYCESIFPGQSYKAAISTNDYIGYFESKQLVSQDGNVYLDDYTLKLWDRNNNKYFSDDKIKEKCLDIVNEHMKYFRIY